MRVPKYRKNTARDVGFVEWNRKRHYLPGKYNSVQSRDAYRAFLARIMATDPAAAAVLHAHGMTLAGLLVAFLDHAARRYGDGTRGEYANCKYALKPLVKSKFGGGLAVKFGPKSLKEWRDGLAGKLSRTYINQQLAKIKRAFRWAASEELIPVTVYQALATVPGLRTGETDAKENRKRVGVPWSVVLATIDELSPLVADMVRVQWFTGCRSSSLCRAKSEQFERAEGLLLWRPRHKTEFLGRELIVPIGPQCQKVLAAYLDREPKAYLFDPRTQRGNRRYRSHYSASSYYRAIRRAIERINGQRLSHAAEHGVQAEQVELLPEWFPHQLRHTRGQQVREQYGIEGSQSLLGHDTIDATQIYSGRRLELAKRIALETG